MPPSPPPRSPALASTPTRPPLASCRRCCPRCPVDRCPPHTRGRCLNGCMVPWQPPPADAAAPPRPALCPGRCPLTRLCAVVPVPASVESPATTPAPSPAPRSLAQPPWPPRPVLPPSALRHGRWPCHRGLPSQCSRPRPCAAVAGPALRSLALPPWLPSHCPAPSPAPRSLAQPPWPPRPLLPPPALRRGRWPSPRGLHGHCSRPRPCAVVAGPATVASPANALALGPALRSLALRCGR